ncbi:MAG: HAD-IA family hydrolase [Planctomycetaceae bacterium]
MTYRWIAFDAVGTLIYPVPTVAEIYATIGRRHGSRLTAKELRSRFPTAFAESVAACLPKENSQLVTSEDLEVVRWKWIVNRVLDDVNDQELCFDELYDHFASPDSWRVFADVEKSLPLLRERGFRLALASNFDQRLHAVCRGLPELQQIERIVVSTEVGTCKPSPRFYEQLLNLCGCGPQELLMIGDDPEHDVAGPRELNIAALLLDREGTSNDPRALRSLEELFTGDQP